MLQDPRFADYEFIWCFKTKKRAAKFRKRTVMSRAQVVQRGSTAYFDMLASAGTIIINTRLPEYISIKENQTFVQCWHGTPLKRLGYDVQIETANALNTTSELAERFGMDSEKWTYLISPSPYTSQHLADAFGLPAEKRESTILELGYPRNDILARAANNNSEQIKLELRYRFGIPSYKKVLLYAPTWRDDSYQAGVGYTFDYLIDFNQLKSALGDDWVVLFRPHYYVANKFDFSTYKGFVYDVSKTSDINELYLLADILVTDYSSVMFDYAILHRPMLFFAPDKDHYDQDIRGFYFDFGKVPGPMSMSTTELIHDINHLDTYWSQYNEHYSQFMKMFCPIDDGYAAERVISRIFPDKV